MQPRPRALPPPVLRFRCVLHVHRHARHQEVLHSTPEELGRLRKWEEGGKGVGGAGAGKGGRRLFGSVQCPYFGVNLFLLLKVE